MLQKNSFLKTLWIVFFFVTQIYGQNDHKYGGFIRIQDTVLIKYKLEFQVDQGKIRGFSITDAGGEHETKSKISGNYNAEKHLISFREIETIYTKSPVSLDNFDFCNVHFETTTFKLGSDKLTGNFKGKFSDGTSCIDGELAMNTYAKINERVEKFSKKVQKSNRIADSIKDQLKNIKIIDTLNLNVLKKNQVTSIPTKSTSLKLFIYDGGQIDDDIISLLVDGKTILSKYRITEEEKEITIPVKKGITQITVVSESNGSVALNTAIIEIQNGRNRIKTMTNIEKGDVTKINILRN